MYWIVQSISNLFQTFMAWLMGAFYALYDMAATTFINWIMYVVNSVQFCICILAFAPIFILDRCIKYLMESMLPSLFAGSILTMFNVSKSALESYIISIEAVAPNIKAIGYVINFDALCQVFVDFFLFYQLWCFYRWFRVWIRG